MGILAPLFLASLAALSLPLLFHLVRRTPRGRQEFSSLMFLSPSPPRLTRRSRLDQILLLLLRVAALVLLALAFARPFLREAALLTESDLQRRRVAILVDNSASMRRGDLWQQAMTVAERELDQLAPHDDIALFAFSDRVERIVAFPDAGSLTSETAVEVVRQQLRGLEPNWSTSNLGLALTTLAGELASASDVQQSQADPQIVVISDFQKGSRTDALTAYEWPQDVTIVTRQLKPKHSTNAHAQLLTNVEVEEDAEPRVRIANAADSAGDQFFVRWASENKTSTEGETAVYVPPGESRVVRLPRPASNLLADRIVLRGDDHDFDNTYYVAPPRKQEVTLVYAGDDKADDPQGLRYYLQLAASGDPLRQVTFTEPGGGGVNVAPIMVATTTVTEEERAALQAYTEQGGTLVLAPATGKAAESLFPLLSDVELLEAKPPREGDFALLGEIDFSHALFVPFASPRYNDFTKIHFWRHHPVKLSEGAKTQVIARFDRGDPWLLERAAGKGRIIALTSSWSPDDSQLAVSSKFVPLIGNLLDLACGSTRPLAGVTVGESAGVRSQESGVSSQYDAPGICRIGPVESESVVAVNLAASESDTAPIQLEQLEQYGVKRGADVTQADRLSHIRQQRDTELEGRQKVWRWLLVGCLLLLIVETLWAGRAARPAIAMEVAA